VENPALEVQVLPLQAKDLTAPHTHHGGHKECRPRGIEGVVSFKLMQDCGDLGGLQDGGFGGAFAGLPDARKGIRWVELVTYRVTECRPEYFANLGL